MLRLPPTDRVRVRLKSVRVFVYSQFQLNLQPADSVNLPNLLSRVRIPSPAPVSFGRRRFSRWNKSEFSSGSSVSFAAPKSKERDHVKNSRASPRIEKC